MRRHLNLLIVVVFAVVAVALSLYLRDRRRSDNADQVLAVMDRPSRQVSHTSGGPNFVDAAKKLEPAVVEIETTTTVQNMFGQTGVLGGLGSGVIISPDGFVVTNAHVVNQADTIVVQTIGGRKLQGYVVGKDVRDDIAVVKVNARNLPYAELGDSSVVQVGEWVMAIGNPLGYENTLTVGVVSGLHRSFADTGVTDFIQTDAAINRGNSGGALANIAGQVIGINSRIATEGRREQGNIGLGFAIPINRVKEIVRMLVRHQRVPVPYVGISVFLEADMTKPEVQDALRRVTGASSVPDHGAVVNAAAPNSPAATAGLGRLDVVVAVGNRELSHPEDLMQAIKESKVGAKLTMKIWRGGTERTQTVTVGDMPDTLRRIQESSPEP